MFVVKDNVANVTPVKVARSLGAETVIEIRSQRRRCRGHRRTSAARPTGRASTVRERKAGADVNISETCIRRPVMTTLIMASFIVFGIFGYRLLPVAALPAVDFPTI